MNEVAELKKEIATLKDKIKQMDDEYTGLFGSLKESILAIDGHVETSVTALQNAIVLIAKRVDEKNLN